MCFGLVHYKCTVRTSNKVDLSPDIVPMKIDLKSKDHLPPFTQDSYYLNSKF